MSKKKICFIAQFPPPIHGLSKAVDTLFNSRLNNKFEFEKIDITKNTCILKNIIKLIKSDADLFYFTISQTKYGNLRDLLILKLVNLKGKKCLIHLHGGNYRKLFDTEMTNLQRKLNKIALQGVSGTIVLGRSLRYIFEGIVEDYKILIVPNCVDDEYIMDDDAFESKIEIQKDKSIKNILYLSNMIKSKGYRNVLELAKEEKKRCQSKGVQKYHFDFCGKFFSEEEKEYFSNYVNENKLSEYVSYHGVVTGDKKRQMLSQSDFFILPTRYPNEGQPISIIEAMANSLYIITTDHAGIPDLVEDKINGILLKKNDKLTLDMLDTADITGVCLNNRLAVKKYYTQDIYIQNMESCFVKIL